MNKSIYRTIDANFNRSREGLRVCEEVARFLLNDKPLTRDLKNLRHEITCALNTNTRFKSKLLQARSVKSDVGKKNSNSEFKRNDARDIFEANIERSKEAVRALEEFFKLVSKSSSRKFKCIRFRIYDLEKGSFEKLEALRNIR